MFRISVLVEDNKLAKALTSLNGLCYNMEVLPVANAEVEPKTRKVRETGANSGFGLVCTLLREQMHGDPNNNQIRSVDLVRVGKDRFKVTEASIYSGVARDVRDGILTKGSFKGLYIINRSKL